MPIILIATDNTKVSGLEKGSFSLSAGNLCFCITYCVPFLSQFFNRIFGVEKHLAWF